MNIMINALPTLLQGMLVTLEIAGLASLIGFILGTIIGIAQIYAGKAIKLLTHLYVSIIRGTPMLIQITFMSIILPQFGFSMLATAIIAIGLNSAAYISQIIKAGIQSVGQGQIEAAYVLGLSQWQTIRYIVLPQAIKVVVPALVNEIITLIKDSSLASIIGVVELFKTGTIIISRTYNAIPIYCAIAFLYLILTYSLTTFVHVLQKKWNLHVVD